LESRRVRIGVELALRGFKTNESYFNYHDPLRTRIYSSYIVNEHIVELVKQRLNIRLAGASHPELDFAKFSEDIKELIEELIGLDSIFDTTEYKKNEKEELRQRIRYYYQVIKERLGEDALKKFIDKYGDLYAKLNAK